MLILVSGVIITIAIDAVFGKGDELVSCHNDLHRVSHRNGIRDLPAERETIPGDHCHSHGNNLFLWLIDHFTGDNGWSRSLGLPMALSGALLVAAVIFLNSLSKYRGLNLLATILVALAALCHCHRIPYRQTGDVGVHTTVVRCHSCIPSYHSNDIHLHSLQAEGAAASADSSISDLEKSKSL